MKQYLDLLQNILENGEKRDNTTKTRSLSILGETTQFTFTIPPDRTIDEGTERVSLFNTQTRYKLIDGFPLVTTKKINSKSIIHELLRFLEGGIKIKFLRDNSSSGSWIMTGYKQYKGDTNIKYLQDNGVKIWNERVDENGSTEPVFGRLWRHFYQIEQITDVIDTLKNNLNSRLIKCGAWNPQDVDELILAPIHTIFEFSVINNKLDCELFQQSANCFLEVPINIASHSLLTMMVAQVCDLELGDFIYTIGDTYIYLDHIEQVKLQLSREPYPLPLMKLNPTIKDIFNFKYKDFELVDYKCHPSSIKEEVIV
jgi:thymidylate synthase